MLNLGITGNVCHAMAEMGLDLDQFFDQKKDQALAMAAWEG
jgi:hypothetical protein